ncbi:MULTISPECIES: glycosyltransferase family 9 protein [Erwinia]|uniref:glycosyltransferase family 9 protein n=1 Tax=Erwinia TaxID=551 RepID=UPI0014884321|nr:glycosyltransferase family 9 protein [Erwinia sp. JH02]NNS09364.1 glycosyltransferase family 9 protein [Erwinia sp. JH02]
MSKRWKIKAISLFLVAYTRCTGRLNPSRNVNPETNFRNIVIYSTTALGDLLFNTPAIRAIRTRYPNARITLIAHEKFREFVEEGADWDDVVYWNNKIVTMRQMISTLKSCIGGSPDLALLLHSHEPYDYLSAILAGAEYVIRDNYHDGFEPRDRWLADYTIGFVGHVIQRKLALVEPLGCDVSNIEMKLPTVPAVLPATDSRVIGFQMGASKPERSWPTESFARVAEAILQYSDETQIVLIGGPGEKSLATALYQHLDEQYHHRVIDHVGNTGLNQLTSLIGSFELLLTGDTGPLHIAIAAKVPTVSLFVTANPYATGPLQDRHLHEVIYAARRKSNLTKEHVMSLIKSDTVIEKIHSKLILK